MPDGTAVKPYFHPGYWRQRIYGDYWRDASRGYLPEGQRFEEYAFEKLEGMKNAGEALSEQQERERKRLKKFLKRRAER
jgi:hypothetical protein